jgi:hypothetical protein
MSISLTEHDIRVITFNFHALHYDVLQPKLGLDSVYALIVPTGESIRPDLLEQLFQIGGFDPITSTPDSEQLTRIACDKVDLLMFGYQGLPDDFQAWMTLPDLSVGAVLSNMITVRLFEKGEGNGEYALSPAMLTTTVGPDMMLGLVRIDDECFAEITPTNFEALIAAAAWTLNISR